MKKAKAVAKRPAIYFAEITSSLVHTLELQENQESKSYLDWLEWFAMLGCDDMLYASKMTYPSSIKTDTEDGARLLYELATDAVLALTQLYKSNPALFRKLTREKNVLPCLLSIHPDSLKMAKEMRDFSELGTEGGLSLHVNRRSYFEETPTPLRYVDAIVDTIGLERDCIRGWMEESNLKESEVYRARRKCLLDWERNETNQKRWAKTPGRAIRGVDFVTVYPKSPPKWTHGILELRPFGTDDETTLAWWRKGKEIMREEMPNFQDRPEWKRNAQYQHMSTKCKRHAIFSAILSAMRTLAKAGRRFSSENLVE